MTYTINLAQLNTIFGVAMPGIVAFIAGLIRQDRFPSRINDLISYVVIVILALVQTLLGGQFGGSIGNFILVAAWSIAALHTRYGQDFQGKVQTATSIAKLPPAPAAPPALPTVNINPEQVAALILQNLNMPQLAALLKSELLASNVAVPVPDQPTQANIPAIKTGG